MSSTAPEPTTSATVKVGTSDFRAGLRSVHAHHQKGMKEDARAQHRIRLIFANGTLFTAASNNETTALAKQKYVEDSRGSLWVPTDSPLIVDLQPRHVPLIAAWLSKKATASDVDQLVAMTVDVRAGEIEFEDIGGLWSNGERQIYTFDDPNEAFPDVVAITGKALNEVAGAGERQSDLVQDGAVIKRFETASKQYGAQLRIRKTGGPETRGFVVQCGPGFIGTMTSRHGEDDGLKTRDKIDAEWRRVLGAKLTAVG
jgi:hypothetical protein